MDTQTAPTTKKNKFNLKGLFVKEDVPTSPVTTSPTPVAAQTYSPGPLYQSPLPTTTSTDPEVRDALLQSLQEKQLAGFDYLKYVAALAKMAGTEESRFRNAFVVAEQLGVTKAQLIKTADHYKEVLARDLQDFNSSFAETQAKEVGAHEDRIKEIDTTITAINTQIQQLNAQVTQLQQEKGTLSGQVMENRTKLEVRKRSFEVTHAALLSEIDANSQKINQYIS
jgi:septal ring factor EnvC (AmiA/AmiB activator)